MNNRTIITILIVIAIIMGGFLLWNLLEEREPELLPDPIQNNDEPIPPIQPNDEEPIENDITQEQREAMVEQYIRNNISDLSPEPEVLGGTFYVTDIRFTDENSGVVEYEDGHIALTADFNYTFDAQGNPQVTLSNVQEL